MKYLILLILFVGTNSFAAGTHIANTDDARKWCTDNGGSVVGGGAASQSPTSYCNGVDAPATLNTGGSGPGHRTLYKKK